MDGEFIEMDVFRPRNGYRVMFDRYWLMRNGKALVYRWGTHEKHLSPQCSYMKEVVEYMQSKPGFSDCEVKTLSIAYFPLERP